MVHLIKKVLEKLYTIEQHLVHVEGRVPQDEFDEAYRSLRQAQKVLQNVK